MASPRHQTKPPRHLPGRPFALAGARARRRGAPLPFVEQISSGWLALSIFCAPASRPPRDRRSTSQLAFLLPEVSLAYGLDLLRAVEKRAGEAGFSMVLTRTRGLQDQEERAIDRLVRSRAVDGLIVFPVNGEFYNASLLRVALEGYPLVLVDRYLKGIAATAVYTDNVAAARDLTGHVLDNGCDSVAFVSSHPD